MERGQGVRRTIGKESANWRMFVSYWTRTGEKYRRTVCRSRCYWRSRTPAATRRCSMTCDSCSRAPVFRVRGHPDASARQAERESGARTLRDVMPAWIGAGISIEPRSKAGIGARRRRE